MGGKCAASGRHAYSLRNFPLPLGIRSAHGQVKRDKATARKGVRGVRGVHAACAVQRQRVRRRHHGLHRFLARQGHPAPARLPVCRDTRQIRNRETRLPCRPHGGDAAQRIARTRRCGGWFRYPSRQTDGAQPVGCTRVGAFGRLHPGTQLCVGHAERPVRHRFLHYGRHLRTRGGGAYPERAQQQPSHVARVVPGGHFQKDGHPDGGELRGPWPPAPQRPGWGWPAR